MCKAEKNCVKTVPLDFLWFSHCQVADLIPLGNQVRRTLRLHILKRSLELRAAKVWLFHPKLLPFFVYVHFRNEFLHLKTCKFTWKSGKFLWSFWRVIKNSMGISRCFKFRCKFRTAEASDWMAFFLHLGGKYSWNWRRRTQAVMTQWGGEVRTVWTVWFPSEVYQNDGWWLLKQESIKHFSACLRVVIVVDLSKKLKKNMWNTMRPPIF